MSIQTKIIATVSDERCDVSFIRSLYENGVTVVRLNTAHLDYEGFKRVVNNVRVASPEIGILIDTKGPEVRTTSTVEDKEIFFILFCTFLFNLVQNSWMQDFQISYISESMPVPPFLQDHFSVYQ